MRSLIFVWNAVETNNQLDLQLLHVGVEVLERGDQHVCFLRRDVVVHLLKDWKFITFLDIHCQPSTQPLSSEAVRQNLYQPLFGEIVRAPAEWSPLEGVKTTNKFYEDQKTKVVFRKLLQLNFSIGTGILKQIRVWFKTQIHWRLSSGTIPLFPPEQKLPSAVQPKITVKVVEGRVFYIKVDRNR